MARASTATCCQYEPPDIRRGGPDLVRVLSTVEEQAVAVRLPPRTVGWFPGRVAGENWGLAHPDRCSESAGIARLFVVSLPGLPGCCDSLRALRLCGEIVTYGGLNLSLPSSETFLMAGGPDNSLSGRRRRKRLP